jgi:hypothetical protein
MEFVLQTFDLVPHLQVCLHPWIKLYNRTLSSTGLSTPVPAMQIGAQ